MPGTDWEKSKINSYLLFTSSYDIVLLWRKKATLLLNVIHQLLNNEINMARMTDEEADALDELWTRTTIKVEA